MTTKLNQLDDFYAKRLQAQAKIVRAVGRKLAVVWSERRKKGKGKR